MRPFGPGPLADVNVLSSQLVQLAQRLAAVVDDPASQLDIDAAYVRALISARRRRERYFPGMFSDPAWDILLDLTAAALERRDISTSSLCIAANVPTSTALRQIKAMLLAGLLERNIDPDDARRSYIRLSSETLARMTTCLREYRRSIG